MSCLRQIRSLEARLSNPVYQYCHGLILLIFAGAGLDEALPLSGSSKYFLCLSPTSSPSSFHLPSIFLPSSFHLLLLAWNLPKSQLYIVLFYGTIYLNLPSFNFLLPVSIRKLS